jgi:ribose transport system permease protein
VIGSLLAGLAGLLLSGYAGLVDNWAGQGFELDSIVAAMIGDVALSGGRGTILGALVGAAVIVVIGNEALMFGLPVPIRSLSRGSSSFWPRRCMRGLARFWRSRR